MWKAKPGKKKTDNALRSKQLLVDPRNIVLPHETRIRKRKKGYSGRADYPEKIRGKVLSGGFRRKALKKLSSKQVGKSSIRRKRETGRGE